MITSSTKAIITESEELHLAKADPNAKVWPKNHQQGRQGDVLIQRLKDDDPRLDKAALMSRTRVVDRVLARGSRAKHVVSPEATVYEDKDGVLVVSATEFALTHTDVEGHRHHPHILPAGAYFACQQQEETVQGSIRVMD